MKTHSSPIYLDYNATTPTDERVLEKMLPYFTQKFGNAASKTHTYGWVADAAVEQARKQLAQLINADSSEIIFTSGATEGINLILRGIVHLYKSKGKHIITCKTEHKAVLDTCSDLEEQGFEITRLSVNQQGQIDMADLEKSIRADTILIALMWANNETGVIQNVAEIGKLAHEKNVIFFSDATQIPGKLKIDLAEIPIDALCLSAHKFYGPKGVGAIYLRRKFPRVRVLPQITGGGHEKGFRSGTLNVPGIVGMGTAAVLAENEREGTVKKWRGLSKIFLERIGQIPDWQINGAEADKLANTLNIQFKGIKSERLIKLLAQDLACSTGSACTSAIMQPSHVLSAMDLSDAEADASLRISMGRFTTESEMEKAADVLVNAVNKLRNLD